MEKRIAIGPLWRGELLDRLAAALPDWRIEAGAQFDPEAARRATVLVPFGMRVGADLLAGSAIRLIQQFGVGVDPVDLEAARRLGIPVANAPSAVSGMAGSVAEGAVLLVLSCARLPSLRATRLAAGDWNWSAPLNLALAGRRAGLIGLGSIGQAIAQRLAAFDMALVGVRRSGSGLNGDGATFAWVGGPDRLDELIATSDFIVLSAPLTPQTRDLIGRERLHLAKAGTSIVNVGRGAVINEAALLEALDEGRLHAAGLDTIEREPPPPDSPLLTHPRVILTPHDAGVSDLAFAGVAGILADNLARIESGAPLRFRVA
jgi:phosphoglycerate dehydrogenase-like enzyme